MIFKNIILPVQTKKSIKITRSTAEYFIVLTKMQSITNCSEIHADYTLLFVKYQAVGRIKNHLVHFDSNTRNIPPGV